MADGITEIAKLFKSRDNPRPINFELGTVLNTSPFSVKLDTLTHPLDDDDFIIPKRLVNSFENDDRIAVIESVDSQKYLIIDKVVE